MSFLQATLRDHATIGCGQSAPPKNHLSSQGIPFIRASSLPFLLGDGKVEELEHITSEMNKTLNMKLYSKGSILFAKSGISATSGKIYQIKQDSHVVNHLAIVEANTTTLDSRYLMYWLKHRPPTYLIRDQAYPSIRLSDIENIKLPLPKLAEQKRIADILDKADLLRKLYTQRQKRIEHLFHATFLELFGDPLINSKGWKVNTLGNVCDLSQGIQVRTHLQSSEPYEGTTRFLRIVDYTQVIDQHRYIKTPPSKYMIQTHELALVRYGASCGFVCTGLEGALANNMFKVTPKAFINQTFLTYFLKNHKIQQLIKSFNASSTMPALSFKTIKTIPMIQPPVDLQERFAQAVAQITALKKHNTNAQAKANDAFKSLLQRAFKGEL